MLYVGHTAGWDLQLAVGYHTPQLRASITQPKIIDSHRSKGTAANLHCIYRAAMYRVQ